MKFRARKGLVAGWFGFCAKSLGMERCLCNSKAVMKKDETRIHKIITVVGEEKQKYIFFDIG